MSVLSSKICRRSAEVNVNILFSPRLASVLWVDLSMVVVFSAKSKICGGGASASKPPLSVMALVTCLSLWLVPNVNAERGIKLADLQGLSYSSIEFIARVDTLPDLTSRLVLSNESEALDALKVGLLNKHFAEQARRQGLDDLPLVKRALELLYEEVLIDWYVQYLSLIHI